MGNCIQHNQNKYDNVLNEYVNKYYFLLLNTLTEQNQNDSLSLPSLPNKKISLSNLLILALTSPAYTQIIRYLEIDSSRINIQINYYVDINIIEQSTNSAENKHIIKPYGILSLVIGDIVIEIAKKSYNKHNECTENNSNLKKCLDNVFQFLQHQSVEADIIDIVENKFWSTSDIELLILMTQIHKLFCIHDNIKNVPLLIYDYDILKNRTILQNVTMIQTIFDLNIKSKYLYVFKQLLLEKLICTKEINSLNFEIGLSKPRICYLELEKNRHEKNKSEVSIKKNILQNQNKNLMSEYIKITNLDSILNKDNILQISNNITNLNKNMSIITDTTKCLDDEIIKIDKKINDINLLMTNEQQSTINKKIILQTLETNNKKKLEIFKMLNEL